MGERGPQEISTRPSGAGVEVSVRRYRSFGIRWIVRACLGCQLVPRLRVAESCTYRVVPSVSHTSLYSSTDDTTSFGYPVVEAARMPSISSKSGNVFRRSCKSATEPKQERRHTEMNSLPTVPLLTSAPLVNSFNLWLNSGANISCGLASPVADGVAGVLAGDARVNVHS
jgi:hypothetical protein